MLLSRENQACPQACDHRKAISSLIVAAQDHATREQRIDEHRQFEKLRRCPRGTVVSCGTYTTAAMPSLIGRNACIRVAGKI
jgi:hypothetical protein